MITLREVRANNLKGFDATIPLRSLVAVSGVSGSGKSTLITQLLVPAIQAELDGLAATPRESVPLKVICVRWSTSNLSTKTRLAKAPVPIL